MVITLRWTMASAAVLSLLLTLGCGNTRLNSVTISPLAADAQNFPGGQVQFTATGIFNDSPKTVPISNIAWCIGSSDGLCNGNVNPHATLDGNGLAQCTPGFIGTVTILAGTGPPKAPGDGGRKFDVFGVAQLTCP